VAPSSLRGYAALDRRVWVMAGARAVNTMGLSLVMAFMGVYMVTDRKVSAVTWGVIAAIANVFQSLAQGHAGELSDRIGRRGLITGSLLVRAFVVALLGLLVLGHQSVPLLAAAIIASAMLRGCFEPVAYALVADVVSPADRIPAFGLQRMGTNLGWALGPALGGLLATVMPYGAVFFIAGGVLLLAAMTTARVAETRPPPPAPPRARARVARISSISSIDSGDSLDGLALPEPVDSRVSLAAAPAMRLRRWQLATLLVGTFFAAVVHTQLFSTTAIYLATELAMAKGEIGRLYTINGVAVLLLQVPAIAWIRRAGVHAALLTAPLIYLVGFLVMGAASGFWLAATAICCLTAGEVIFAPAHQTAIAETGDPRRMGRAFGLVGTTQVLGVAAAPLIGGLLFDQIGHHHAAMWGALGGFAVAFWISFAIFTRFRGRAVRPTDKGVDVG
jgi:MFS family permease